MNSGRVSIVMPAYNGERYIAAAIESVLGQSYSNWELLIVDDGSTDQTGAIAERHASDRVRCIKKANNGQAAALNTGLDHATGEHYTTLDADDCFTPDSLAVRVQALSESPGAGAVYGDGYYCHEPGVATKLFRDVVPERPRGDVFGALAASPFFGTGANVLVRRSVLAQHGIRYDESILWCQDHDFLLRLAAVTEFERVETPTVWYRQHAASMTSQTAGKRRLDSVLRMKRRAMRSPRFASVSPAHRYQFLYDLLVHDLEGDEAGRAAVFEHEAFRDLDSRGRALLLRLTAAEALLHPDAGGPALAWLRKSIGAYPLDLKTALLLAIAAVNRRAASRAVRRWRSDTAAASTNGSPALG